MIRGITEITDISVIDQNQTDNIYTLRNIEFDEKPIGEGGFGSVHKVYSIDGKNVTQFVLKIVSKEEFHNHSYTTIKLLHEKIKQHQFITKIPVYHELPELIGLPFMVFYGQDIIENNRIVGFLMYDLNELGYKDYSSDLLINNKNLEIEGKFYLAYQLSRVIAFLHSVSFIHSDVNEQSIFINLKQNRLALIDFDSGFNYDKQVKASTIGKVTQWGAALLSNLIKGKKNISELNDKDKLSEECFVLTSAVLEIIFNAMPYFFLVDNDDNTKKKYLKHNSWPNIDSESDIYNNNNRVQHESFLKTLSLLSDNGFDELTSNFIITFNEGYLNDKKRLSANQLKEILAKCNTYIENNPKINSFESNKRSIKQIGESVKFKFELSGFDRVYLNGKLQSLNVFENRITLIDTTEVILRVENDFGISEEKILVSAQRIEPVISYFKSSKSIRDTIEPLMLEWATKNTSRIEISDIIEELPSTGQKEITPNEKTIYILRAFGNFDQEVVKQVEVDILKPTIKLFDWKINLDKGIDNVDLSWETEDAINVSISPRIGEQVPNGIYHIGIAEKTVFVLIAKGLFAEVKQDLEAAPFPIPLIEKLLIPEPIFESNINVTVTISDIVTRIPILSSVEVDNVLFNPINIEFNIQKLPEIESPKFVSANFEIIQKSKPRSLDKIFSKLKFNR